MKRNESTSEVNLQDKPRSTNTILNTDINKSIDQSIDQSIDLISLESKSKNIFSRYCINPIPASPAVKNDYQIMSEYCDSLHSYERVKGMLELCFCNKLAINLCYKCYASLCDQCAETSTCFNTLDKVYRKLTGRDEL